MGTEIAKAGADPLVDLAEGDPETVRYFKWLRKRIKATAAAVAKHDEETLPPIATAEADVARLEKRAKQTELELAKAREAVSAGHESHDAGDERSRRLDHLISLAPDEVLAPLYDVEGQREAPALADHRDLWGEFFGDWVTCPYTGLFNYHGRGGPPKVEVQADEARRGGISVALIRQILRRRRDSLGSHGPEGDEARELNATLIALKAWEE